MIMIQQQINQDTTKAFVAGILISSIAYYFLLRRQQQLLLLNNKDDDDDDEDEDDLFEDIDDDDVVDDGDNEEDDDTNNQIDISKTPIETLISKLKPVDWNRSNGPYKMLLIINMELQMGKGKIAAQCGHAAIGCYLQGIQKCPKALRIWYQTGCAKIALKCPTTSELLALLSLAKTKYHNIPYYIVEDAGRTQIAAGSRTVLGLFAPTFYFDHNFTNHLKLM
jgi:peptidyl-tRNA hydrolase, PTH2 family